jgi:uncharacterized RDD family membrane protein YckC
MKCPKCGYIGYETSERCRNCGYDFALASEPPASPDLPLRTDAPLGPLADFTLEGHEEPPASLRRRAGGSKTDFDFDRYEPPPPPAPDLPLFEDVPARIAEPRMVPAAPPPRPPLAVRRSTPPPTRVRSRTPRSEQVNLDLKIEAPRAAALQSAGAAETGTHAALPGKRAVAALIDALILGPIDLIVIYFTLRLCRLGVQELTVLPVVPMLIFFLILDGGYLLAFTAAGGQTIGKMAMGLKVVGGDGNRVGAGRALARTLAWIVSVAPLGLGLLPAAFDAERRTLHDRVAGTRVVSLHAS